MIKFKLVTAGGTYDHFHLGHKKLLAKAFKISERVIIGVTSDKFKAETPLISRKIAIQEYLSKHKLTDRAEIVEISDIFGPLNKKTSIQAMIVTSDTKPNAIKINNWRLAKGLPTLEIEEVKLELAEDGQPISSTRIRAGEINRDGVVWSKHKIWGELPKFLRQELRKPLGITKDLVLSGGGVTVCVGDVSTIEIIKAGIKPRIAVVDLFVRRKRKYNSLEELNIDKTFKIIKVKNPAGSLTKKSIEVISETFKNLRTESVNYLIHVFGEEDLLTLPIILFAPLGSIVYYGQPPIEAKLSGMVKIKVTEELKAKIFNLLQKFK